MAAKRNRQAEQAGPGWLSTLGGATLLLVVGFAVGMLAGTAWEEPDLVMDHLAGRTTELPLAAEVSANNKGDGSVGADIPSVLLTPVAVTKANIEATVVKDGFWTATDICTSAYASACATAGIS